MANRNRFSWLTAEQRFTAAWMIREGLQEEGFEKLAAAAKSFHEFLAECMTQLRMSEMQAGARDMQWN